MLNVVVLGSSTDSSFAVIDFTSAAAPTSVMIQPPDADRGPEPGMVVASSSNLAAVGSYGASTVWIYDLSNPASPSLINTIYTGVGSIGALSLDGKNLVVGGPPIINYDISTAGGTVVAQIPAGEFGDGGITGMVLQGSTGIACGPYGFSVQSYGTSPPQDFPYVGQINFRAPLTCDFDGATAVIGDGGGVYAFSIVDGIPQDPQTLSSSYEGANAVAVMQDQVAIGSLTYTFVQLLSISGAAVDPDQFTLSTNDNANPGGALKFNGLPLLVASTNNGAGVILFNTEGWPNMQGNTPQPLGVANVNLNSTLYPTIGFTSFWPPGCLAALTQFLQNIRFG
jgi:hypothetical protein